MNMRMVQVCIALVSGACAGARSGPTPSGLYRTPVVEEGVEHPGFMLVGDAAFAVYLVGAGPLASCRAGLGARDPAAPCVYQVDAGPTVSLYAEDRVDMHFSRWSTTPLARAAPTVGVPDSFGPGLHLLPAEGDARATYVLVAGADFGAVALGADRMAQCAAGPVGACTFDLGQCSAARVVGGDRVELTFGSGEGCRPPILLPSMTN